MAEHLRERIIAKRTSVDISAEIAKRGGPETYYAINTNAQRISAHNPDRQEWEREWTTMRTQRDIEIRNLAVEYRTKFAVCSDPPQKKRLRQEQRKAEAAIVKTHQPQDFGAWLHQRNEREAITLERLDALYKQREVGIALLAAMDALRVKQDTEKVTVLEQCWQWVYADTFGAPPPVPVERAGDLESLVCDRLLERAKAWAMPIGLAFRDIYREERKVDPPVDGPALMQLLESEAGKALLAQAQQRLTPAPAIEQKQRSIRPSVADQVRTGYEELEPASRSNGQSKLPRRHAGCDANRLTRLVDMVGGIFSEGGVL